MNAFDQRMWDLFGEVGTSLHGDTLYRAVVITGGPKHFAPGADVKGLLELTPSSSPRATGCSSAPSTAWPPPRR